MAHDLERRIRNPDRWSAAALALLGIYLLYEASSMTFGSISRPGTGFFPIVLAVALLALSVALLVRSWRGTETFSVEIPDRLDHILVTLAMMIAYGALLEFVGFPLLTVALLFVMLWVLGRVSWRMSLTLSVSGTAISFLLFRQLGVPLPSGPIPI